MAFLDWSEALDVGVPSIDTQHKQLVELLNRIEECRKQAVSFEVILPMLDGFCQRVIEHFRYEEKLFTQQGFQEAERHKNEHNDRSNLLPSPMLFRHASTAMLLVSVSNALP